MYNRAHATSNTRVFFRPSQYRTVTSLSTNKLVIITFIVGLLSLVACSHQKAVPPITAASQGPLIDTPVQNSHSLKGQSPLKQVLLQQATVWKGVPYRYGGEDKDGIDCSGLMLDIFKQLGYRLPRTTKQQSLIGESIHYDNIQTGDLLFFKISYKQRHVGVYIDNGQFLHASTSKGVKISNLLTPYWHLSFWQAKRIQFPNSPEQSHKQNN